MVLLPALLAGFLSVQAQGPKTYALIIGISQYKEVSALQFADRDATAFAEYLKTQQVPDDNIKLFLNENATRFNIVDELYNLTETLKPKDRFYFYFGGHGDLEAKISHENSLLLLYNSFKKSYFQGNEYLQLSELKTWFEAMTKKQVEVIFVADACHSGGLIGGKEGTTKTQRALQESWGSITKILSCKSDEFSLEGKQWGGGRGIFSYHLINGLAGLADANKDKKVTLDELDKYLKTNVVKEANPNIQTPVVQGKNTQWMAKVNEEELKKIADYQKRSIPVITEVNIKAKEEKMIGELDRSLVETFKKFNKALIDKRLNTFDDEKDYALLHYKKLAAAKVPPHLLQIMKRNLGAGLMERELGIMKNLREKGKRPIFKDEKLYTPAIANLEETMKLFGSSHYLYNYLQARKVVLESQLPDKFSYINSQTIDKNTQNSAAFFKNYYPSIKGALLKGLELEPNMISTYVLLAFAYITTRQPDSATYYQEKVVELLPNQGYAYYNLGLVYQTMKYVDPRNRLAPHPKAIEYLDKAIEVEPTLKEPYVMLAELHMGRRFEEANRNYAKAIPYFETIAARSEIRDRKFIEQGIIKVQEVEDAGGSYLDVDSKLNTFFDLAYYWTRLCFLHKAVGNTAKSEEYLNKIYQKADMGQSAFCYLLIAYEVSTLLHFKEDENYVKIILDMQLKALKKRKEELQTVAAEDKPLLELKYREQLKAIGGSYRALKNYPEAEHFYEQSITYPVMESSIISNLKLVGSRSYIYKNSNIPIPFYFCISKRPNGDYTYSIDAYSELFFLKWEQNKPEEAFAWLEKAFQVSATEHGNDISGKPFEEEVFEYYKNMDQARFLSLKAKYFPLK